MNHKPETDLREFFCDYHNDNPIFANAIDALLRARIRTMEHLDSLSDQKIQALTGVDDADLELIREVLKGYRSVKAQHRFDEAIKQGKVPYVGKHASSFLDHSVMEYLLDAGRPVSFAELDETIMNISMDDALEDMESAGLIENIGSVEQPVYQMLIDRGEFEKRYLRDHVDTFFNGDIAALVMYMNKGLPAAERKAMLKELRKFAAEGNQMEKSFE